MARSEIVPYRSEVRRPLVPGTVKDLVNVHPATAEVRIGCELEMAGGTVESQRSWLAWFVRIRDPEFASVRSSRCVEDQDGVIDGELGEADEVEDEGATVGESGEQLFRGPELVTSVEREHAAPVATLDVAFPPMTAETFEQGFLAEAELPEVGVTRDDNPVGIGGGGSRGAVHDLRDPCRQLGRFGSGLFGGESGVIEELAVEAGDDEAPEAVGGRGIPSPVGHAAVGVELVDPEGFVGEPDGIGGEIESARGPGGVGPGREAAGQDESQGREQEPVSETNANAHLLRTVGAR